MYTYCSKFFFQNFIKFFQSTAFRYVENLRINDTTTPFRQSTLTTSNRNRGPRKGLLIYVPEKDVPASDTSEHAKSDPYERGPLRWSAFSSPKSALPRYDKAAPHEGVHLYSSKIFFQNSIKFFSVTNDTTTHVNMFQTTKFVY